jgi:predicted Zn-dependent protease
MATWVAAYPNDLYMVNMLFELCSNYHRKADWDNALKWLITAHEKHWQRILEQDAALHGTGKGGLATYFLEMMIDVYQQKGDIENAKKCLDELSALMPAKDMTIHERIQNNVENKVHSQQILQEYEKTAAQRGSMWVIWLIVNVVIFSLIVYMLVRKTKK